MAVARKKKLDPQLGVALVWVVGCLLNVALLFYYHYDITRADGADSSFSEPVDKLIWKYVEFYGAFLTTTGTLLARKKITATASDAHYSYFWVASLLSVLFNGGVTLLTMGWFWSQTVQSIDRAFDLVVAISPAILGPLVILYFGLEK